MTKEKLIFLTTALMCGSLVGGIALDGFGLPASVAAGAGAGVTAAVFWHTRKFWNRR